MDLELSASYLFLDAENYLDCLDEYTLLFTLVMQSQQHETDNICQLLKQLWSESNWVRKNFSKQADSRSTAVPDIHTYCDGTAFDLIQRRALQSLFA